MIVIFSPLRAGHCLVAPATTLRSVYICTVLYVLTTVPSYVPSSRKRQSTRPMRKDGRDGDGRLLYDDHVPSCPVVMGERKEEKKTRL